MSLSILRLLRLLLRTRAPISTTRYVHSLSIRKSTTSTSQTIRTTQTVPPSPACPTMCCWPRPARSPAIHQQQPCCQARICQSRLLQMHAQSQRPVRSPYEARPSHPALDQNTLSSTSQSYVTVSNASLSSSQE